MFLHYVGCFFHSVFLGLFLILRTELCFVLHKTCFVKFVCELWLFCLKFLYLVGEFNYSKEIGDIDLLFIGTLNFH